MLDDIIQNPFPGLRAFEEEEDILFFGREKQVDELLKKLRTQRFLTVIGSSFLPLPTATTMAVPPLLGVTDRPCRAGC